MPLPYNVVKLTAHINYGWKWNAPYWLYKHKLKADYQIQIVSYQLHKHWKLVTDRFLTDCTHTQWKLATIKYGMFLTDWTHMQWKMVVIGTECTLVVVHRNLKLKGSGHLYKMFLLIIMKTLWKHITDWTVKHCKQVAICIESTLLTVNGKTMKADSHLYWMHITDCEQ